MSTFKLLKRHYEYIESIRSIEEQNEDRKKLIRLAVLKVVLLSSTATTKATKSNSSPTIKNSTDSKLDPNVRKITEDNHKYELAISKLEQQSLTKERISESKIESLREEIDRLKKEISLQDKRNGARSAKSFNPSTASLLTKPNTFTSSYLNANPYSRNLLSPPTDSVKKASLSPSEDDYGILSPIKMSKIRKSKSGIFDSTDDLHDLLNNKSSKSKENESASKFKNSLINTRPTVLKSPTRRSFVKNFDASLESLLTTPTKDPKMKRKWSNSASTSAATSRSGSAGSFVSKLRTTSNDLKESDVDQPDANSTSLLNTNVNNLQLMPLASEFEDESFVSATNLSQDDYLTSTSTPANHALKNNNNVGKKKKRRIQILKSQASKFQVSDPNVQAVRDGSLGLHLENEDIDSLNYYDDENFKSTENSPRINIQKSTLGKQIEQQKQPSVEPTNGSQTALREPVFKKKKKNVFKID